ncbi:MULTISPECIES: DUF5325 family protein [unclassified Rummeliibacillus]|uniref:DUF5325 family protein n=1 Tax=unclassified Rummeliibacillus TaxID=2622809 RepID=UPI000E6706FB|nr:MULTISPECIES: DUF5325 family protein [unclassified Rummeliibacillus]RIJ67752.1 hypothetical protein D1606_04130 [Rummeliibacillus sp. POC4]RPJ94225.1 hypothetical protein CW357_16540 [Rummeliibacillus sp. TYF005]
MNKAKIVMAIFALAGILAMCSIGYAIAASSILGIIGGIIAVCVVFGLAFKTKRQFRDKGLL